MPRLLAYACDNKQSRLVGFGAAKPPAKMLFAPRCERKTTVYPAATLKLVNAKVLHELDEIDLVKARAQRIHPSGGIAAVAQLLVRLRPGLRRSTRLVA